MRAIWYVGGIVLVFCAPATAQEASVADVLQRLAEAAARIQSLAVTYVSGDMSVKNADFPPGTHLRREIACARPDFYMHWSFHPHDGLTWEDDPLQQRLYLQQATWYNFNPVKNIFNTGVLKSGEPLPGTSPAEFLFFATGVWLLDRPAPRFNDVPIYLHELPAIAGTFRHLGDETVHGASCLVIGRPGIDKMWIDRQRPGVLIAHEFFEKQSDNLLQRVELLDHKEVAPGIWFPRMLKNVLSHAADNSSLPMPKESLLHVLAVRVNCDESARFAWTPPAGALNVNSMTAPKQASPGGIDQLDRMLRFADQPNSNRGGPNRQNWILVAAVFIASFCIFAAIPFRNRRSSPMHEAVRP